MAKAIRNLADLDACNRASGMVSDINTLKLEEASEALKRVQLPANADLTAGEIKFIRDQVKQQKRDALGARGSSAVNAQLVSLSMGMKMFSCAYKHGLKDHKEIIIKASNYRNGPLRLLMIATIGLIASLMIVTLMYLFKEPIAWVVGFVTLLLSTLEYWFRKGILETYLLDWTKKRYQLRFAQGVPDCESVSVALLELEHTYRKQLQSLKRQIKSFHEPAYMSQAWSYYLHCKGYGETDLSAGQAKAGRTELVTSFVREYAQTLDTCIDSFKKKLSRLRWCEQEGLAGYTNVKRLIEHKIWQCWLDEQGESIIKQLSDPKARQKKYLKPIAEQLAFYGVGCNKNWLNTMSNNKLDEADLADIERLVDFLLARNQAAD